MADVKISGLPASTVPLAGTEVLPIVQGGATKQVSIANVTAGRSVAALSVITPTIQAEAGSAGGTIKNGSGVAQMQWGSGGASNLSLEVATNINPANAAVSIAPTGTGTVTINPATASTMNNVAIGGTTPLAGSFTTVTGTQLNVDNLQLDANIISSTDTNGIVDLLPNGTGDVRVTNRLTFRSNTQNSTGSLASFRVTVSTSAVEIAGYSGTWGHIAIVTGLDPDPAQGFFTDLVFSSVTAGPTVLSAKTVSGAPSARTYSMSGGDKLQLAMASGTYDVRSSILYGLS
jgi:hypothetical protein